MSTSSGVSGGRRVWSRPRRPGPLGNPDGLSTARSSPRASTDPCCLRRRLRVRARPLRRRPGHRRASTTAALTRSAQARSGRNVYGCPSNAAWSFAMQRGRRAEDSGVRDDAGELVDAGPGQGPGRLALGQLPDEGLEQPFQPRGQGDGGVGRPLRLRPTRLPRPPKVPQGSTVSSARAPSRATAAASGRALARGARDMPPRSLWGAGAEAGLSGPGLCARSGADGRQGVPTAVILAP
jgi:hypothetical protein